VNVHNSAKYLSRFGATPHCNPRWSPEIYSLSLRQRAWLQGKKYNLRGLGPAYPTPCTCTQGTAAADAR
jgi:hypothetical protein